MEKRTILAMVLIFAVYIIFNRFIWKQEKVSPPAKTKPATQAAAPTAKSNVALATDSLLNQAVFQDKNGYAEQFNDKIYLHNDRISVSFTNRGGMIRQVNLKDFRDAAGKTLNLIPDSASVAGLTLIKPNSTLNLDGLLFHHEQMPDGKSIVFFIGNDQGRIIEKTYTLNDDYGIKMTVRLHSADIINGYELKFPSGIADTETYLKAKKQDYKLITQLDNEIKSFPMPKVAKGLTGSGKLDWIAVRSKYFTIATRDEQPVLARGYNANVNRFSPYYSIQVKADQPGKEWDESFTLYIGPADYKLLQKYGGGMEQIPERGSKWLRWLTDGFSWFLTWLYRYIKNFGIVIIIFSIILKIILHPLTHKSMEATVKMQKTQPLQQELLKKYGNDQKRLMEEYKKAGINPVGCFGVFWPMLLQMPIFFSLYTVLRYSLDMRNAGFALWLKDLSEPDPYLILPIFMGATMILQSMMMKQPQLNPDEMDEKQKAAQSSQKMMTWLMPIMFFFIFKGMPSGLVLYYTVFNLISMVQQYYLQKHFHAKDKS